MTRNLKIVLALLADAGFCLFSVWFSFYLRLGDFVSLERIGAMPFLASIFLAWLSLYGFGVYRAIFHSNGLLGLLPILKASFVYSTLFFLIFTVYGIDGVPRTIGILQSVLLFTLIAASRIVIPWLYEKHLFLPAKKSLSQNVLIYGAGEAGRQLAAAIGSMREMKVAAFIDDSKILQNKFINGIRVYSPKKTSFLVKKFNISDVLIAMPSAQRSVRNKLIESMRKEHVTVRTLPGMADLASGKVEISDLRELDINELLGRPPVKPNQKIISDAITNKTVLITGAGGSIGSELCRQIVQLNPKTVILLERNEYALYEIHQELEKKNIGVELISVLASVRNKERLCNVMSLWKPDTVYHAAAYKHVPLVEQNIIEGISNNVFGTYVCATTSIEKGVRDFVLVSTDKAVRPTNVMGASKRLSELILQGLSEANSKTTLSMVRFGNVLGSSGSVVPKFRSQIKDGGPLTLTHSDIERYFMTMPEAAQLVIQAGAMAKGGDVFVLDMGKPVKIIDLARRMIELSGFTVLDERNFEGDIEIKITGLRPGEKLYEELLIGGNPEKTSHERILRANEEFIAWTELEAQLNLLETKIKSSDEIEVLALLRNLVPDYKPHTGP